MMKQGRWKLPAALLALFDGLLHGTLSAKNYQNSF